MVHQDCAPNIRFVLRTQWSSFWSDNLQVALLFYSASLKFSFKFRISDPDVSDGLLMYAAQSGDGQGDFASVAIKDQHLEFRFDTGSGKINSEVGRRVWHYETLSCDVNMEEESQPKM